MKKYVQCDVTASPKFNGSSQNTRIEIHSEIGAIFYKINMQMIKQKKKCFMIKIKDWPR